jgi:uncharacterized protein (TIGR02246 family)
MDRESARGPILTWGSFDLAKLEERLMKNRRVLTLAFGLTAVLAFGLLRGNGAMPVQPGEPATKGGETPGKGKRAQEFIAAFNKGDAKAVAGFWTPDGDYTDQEGNKYRGRKAIEKLYTKLFGDEKGMKLTITVTSLKQLSPEVALEEGTTEVTFVDGGPPSVSGFTAVLVKKDGEWYFQSVQETTVQPPSNAEHFEDLEWLIGDWATETKKEEGNKGETLKASYSWDDNKNFIVGTFTTELDGLPVMGGTQWIAWDAVDKKVRSWSFYSGGGFGEAVWTKEQGKLIIKLTAKTASGKKVSATNILTKKGPAEATWQMTKLTVDGESMPDRAPIKMVRVLSENRD